jgi:hypothetical protein
MKPKNCCVAGRGFSIGREPAGRRSRSRIDGTNVAVDNVAHTGRRLFTAQGDEQWPRKLGIAGLVIGARELHARAGETRFHGQCATQCKNRLAESPGVERRDTEQVVEHRVTGELCFAGAEHVVGALRIPRGEPRLRAAQQGLCFGIGGNLEGHRTLGVTDGRQYAQAECDNAHNAECRCSCG